MLNQEVFLYTSFPENLEYALYYLYKEIFISNYDILTA